MWKHYCEVEKSSMEIGDGEECNWCGAVDNMDEEPDEDQNARHE